MTRKRKIELLRKKGVNIDCHRTTARIIIDAIEIDSKWHVFKITIADQVKAGQLIDKIFIEYVEKGEIKHE